MHTIEVEVRSFVTEEQYDELLSFFRKEGMLVSEDTQETHYFDCDADVRIQKNDTGAKIWMKGGALHDDHREETEIPVNGEDFNKLEKVFCTLGHGTEIKWFRKRYTFTWDDVTVCLDDTKGYGRILELEQMASEDTKEEVLNGLKEKMKTLGIPITPKEEFKKKFEEYKKNWKTLV